MKKVQQSIVLLVFTISIISLFMIILGNNVFAIEYSKHANNEDVIFYDYVNPSKEDNSMIFSITTIENSNQYKIDNCAISYHNMIPKIYRDDPRYWEGSKVSCAYGLYNYNVNIGNKNLDPILRIQIEGEAELCMLDDHCMKKINQIIKGKIALQSQSSPPKLQDPPQSIPKKSPQQEEQELISFCAHYFYAVDQPQSCDNLTPELKQKVEIKSKKVEDSTQTNLTTVNQQKQPTTDKDDDDKDDDRDEDNEEKDDDD